jgi:hypothetical protein
MIDPLFKFFSSLRLTVACFSLALVLVFVGTLAQVQIGLYMAQEQYFRSLFVYWSPQGSDFKIPVWPGGYLLGGVLLINLIAAHIKRFSWSRKKTGIFLIHSGLILLFIGQFLTEVLQVESHLRLEEGETKNYSESDRKSELAIIDVTDPQEDKVFAIHEKLLAKKGEIQHPELPFRIRVKEYYPNSRLHNRAADATNSPPATHGFGPRIELMEVPLATAMNERSIPTTIFEVVTPQGSMGTWLVSNMIDDPQSFVYQGRTYQVSSRWIRYYKPFSMHLIEFTHDRYKGTEIPKNFSSHLQLNNPSTGEDREVLIYMNNPLRYGGETFYQGGFEPGDTVSILQVVRNPAWLTPYVSVTLVGVGLLVQFLSHLISFIKRRTP